MKKYKCILLKAQNVLNRILFLFSSSIIEEWVWNDAGVGNVFQKCKPSPISKNYLLKIHKIIYWAVFAATHGKSPSTNIGFLIK